MANCPVCNTPMEANSDTCKACGYHLQGTTEEFKAVSLDSTTSDVAEAKATVPTLTVLSGKQKGIVYRLEGESAVVGRSPKCEVFLNDMTVSRSHAVLERVAEGWSIRDTGSFNGVWVNNTNIDHVMLNDHDVIQIGSFLLRYAV